MVTTAEARARQLWLQQQGAKLLKHFHLVDVLSKFGRTEPIGSYSYGLMQVPDIDFKVYCQTIDSPAVRRLANRMAGRSDVMGIRFLDFTKLSAGERKGVYLNIFTYFQGELWKLDIHFLNAADERSDHSTLISRLRSLSQEERDIILTLKAALLEIDRYSHPTIFHTTAVFHGVEIYQAVMEGARTVSDLERWKAAKSVSGKSRGA
jgi:hypothetical protein